MPSFDTVEMANLYGKVNELHSLAQHIAQMIHVLGVIVIGVSVVAIFSLIHIDRTLRRIERGPSHDEPS